MTDAAVASQEAETAEEIMTADAGDRMMTVAVTVPEEEAYLPCLPSEETPTAIPAAVSRKIKSSGQGD